eukprot:scaffold3005_cov102-Skeletonema_dohrnii-CCMP3373.AAC.5
MPSYKKASMEARMELGKKKKDEAKLNVINNKSERCGAMHKDSSFWCHPLLIMSKTSNNRGGDDQEWE